MLGTMAGQEVQGWATSEGIDVQVELIKISGTATAQALSGTATQQARWDAQATAEQKRSDAQATSEQERRLVALTQAAQATEQARQDAVSTAEQARQDAQNTQAAALTQAIQPTHDSWTATAVNVEATSQWINLQMQSASLEQKQIEVEKAQSTKFVSAWYFYAGGVVLLITGTWIMIKALGVRVVRNDETGEVETVIVAGKVVTIARLDRMLDPAMSITKQGGVKSHAVSNLENQIATTQRAQTVDLARALASGQGMPQGVKFNINGAFGGTQPVRIGRLDEIEPLLAEAEDIFDAE